LDNGGTKRRDLLVGQTVIIATKKQRPVQPRGLAVHRPLCPRGQPCCLPHCLCGRQPLDCKE
jgi:hypothetical protein